MEIPQKRYAGAIIPGMGLMESDGYIEPYHVDYDGQTLTTLSGDALSRRYDSLNKGLDGLDYPISPETFVFYAHFAPTIAYTIGRKVGIPTPAVHPWRRAMQTAYDLRAQGCTLNKPIFQESTDVALRDRKLSRLERGIRMLYTLGFGVGHTGLSVDETITEHLVSLSADLHTLAGEATRYVDACAHPSILQPNGSRWKTRTIRPEDSLAQLEVRAAGRDVSWFNETREFASMLADRVPEISSIYLYGSAGFPENHDPDTYNDWDLGIGIANWDEKTLQRVYQQLAAYETHPDGKPLGFVLFPDGLITNSIAEYYAPKQLSETLCVLYGQVQAPELTARQDVVQGLFSLAYDLKTIQGVWRHADNIAPDAADKHALLAYIAKLPFYAQDIAFRAANWYGDYVGVDQAPKTQELVATAERGLAFSKADMWAFFAQEHGYMPQITLGDVDGAKQLIADSHTMMRHIVKEYAGVFSAFYED